MSRDPRVPAHRQRREALKQLAENQQRRIAAARSDVTSSTFGEEDDPDGPWDRNIYGDVRNRRAFDRHMDQVGEEDQSAP